jgi:hypothetical protein
MLPHSFSFHEAYGKHRSPDEIRESERQNRIMEARCEMYGEPVNTTSSKQDPPANWEKNQYIKQRRTIYGFLLFRPFSFFFSLFSPRT